MFEENTIGRIIKHVQKRYNDILFHPTAFKSMGLKFTLTNKGTLLAHYEIKGHIVRVANVKYGSVPNRNGYPYQAAIMLDDQECATYTNHGDGALGDIDTPELDDARRLLLRNIEKDIRDKDKKFRTLENVCEKLIDFCA